MDIRYRAYDKTRRRWIYWDDLAISPCTPAEAYNDGCVWQSAAPDGRLSDESTEGTDHIVFQLSSGRKDSRGVEVFAGDIVIQSAFDERNTEFRGVVVFNPFTGFTINVRIDQAMDHPHCLFVDPLRLWEISLRDLTFEKQL